MDNNFKKCPFCAEEIKIEAIKCKHCGSLITAQSLPSSNIFSHIISVFLFYKSKIYNKLKSVNYEEILTPDNGGKLIVLALLTTIFMLLSLYFFKVIAGILIIIVTLGEGFIVLTMLEGSFAKKFFIFISLLFLQIMGFFIFIFGKNVFLPWRTNTTVNVTVSNPVGLIPTPAVILKQIEGTIIPTPTVIFIKQIEEKEVNITYNIEVNYKENMHYDYLQRCKRNLENIATSLEMYSVDNAGNYPPSLDYLKRASLSYMYDIPFCPACGKPYIYERYDNPDDFILKCGGENAHFYTGQVQKGHFPICKPGVRVYFMENVIEENSFPKHHIQFFPVHVK